MLVGSLREVIAKQATEIESLQNKLDELTASSVAVASAAVATVKQSLAESNEVSYLFQLKIVIYERPCERRSALR